MKSHSEGYDGLRRIFNEQDIDISNWVHEPIDKERGGISFMLPNSEGKIYLNYGDLYEVDMVFVSTKKNYKQTLQLGDLQYILNSLESSRQSHVKQLRELLKSKFSE